MSYIVIEREQHIILVWRPKSKKARKKINGALASRWGHMLRANVGGVTFHDGTILQSYTRNKTTFEQAKSLPEFPELMRESIARGLLINPALINIEDYQ